jgi:hypothetical protein
MLLALAFVASLSVSTPDADRVDLVEAVRAADVAVHGEVLSLRYVPVGPGAVSDMSSGCIETYADGVQLAEVAVLREFKGLDDVDRTRVASHEPPTRSLWVRLPLAPSRELEVGSTAVWLLERSDTSCGVRDERASEDEPVNAALRREVGADSVFKVGAWGRGVLLESNDSTGARIGGLQRFVLPPELTAARPDGAVLPLRVELERVLVDRIERQAQPLLELALLPAPGQADAWRLHLRRDGRVRIEGLPESDAAPCPLKLRSMTGLAAALLDGDLPPQHSAARIRGAKAARYELTLHTRDGLRRYTVHVEPDAPENESDGRLASVWSALVSAVGVESRSIPTTVRRGLGLGAGGTVPGSNPSRARAASGGART